MNFKELYEAVSIEKEIDPTLSKEICQSIFNVISNSLQNGESVNIFRFGVFEVRTREARVGFNPRTREKLEIPAKQYPAFKPSKTLKDMF